MNAVIPLHQTKQWSVERQMIEGQAPRPEDVLANANSEPDKPRYVCASSYADAVHVLRAKGFTWSEVTEWMNARGVEFSQQAFIAGYRQRYA